MPELPEVETMRRNIERLTLGRAIVAVDLTLPKLLRDSPIPELTPIVGQRFTTARRRAKILIVGISNDLSLLIHCKLAGQIAIFAPDGERAVAGHPVPSPVGPYPHKSTHLRIDFEDGTILYYSDIRQFGWLRVMPSEDVDAAIAEFGFGPEAWGAPLDTDALDAVIQRRGIPIKTLLLDQSFIAGLGNIYVDETLFAACVHPARPARSLTADERARILEFIPLSLEEGVKQGGARIINSKAYPVDNFPAVHGREGEPCFRCGTPIQKIRVGQRGTYFCPNCQLLDRAPA
ncbi:MAG TPA: DNA-formamidopyrimidine glycosylase [Thermomicrobiales bacterium]|nr:DNA-formamidopyrimidine glycosylase [Thermomicrobiales bacterium]